MLSVVCIVRDRLSWSEATETGRRLPTRYIAAHLICISNKKRLHFGLLTLASVSRFHVTFGASKSQPVNMVSSWCYFILPVLLIIGLLRKCRERSWGRCKSTSNLHGQVFLVTGANSGIGKETVKELVRRRATVIMACRDMRSAKSVVAEIRNKISTGELVNAPREFIYLFFFIKEQRRETRVSPDSFRPKYPNKMCI